MINKLESKYPVSSYPYPSYNSDTVSQDNVYMGLCGDGLMYPCRVLGNGPHCTAAAPTVLLTFLRGEYICSHLQRREVYELPRSREYLCPLPDAMIQPVSVSGMMCAVPSVHVYTVYLGGCVCVCGMSVPCITGACPRYWSYWPWSATTPPPCSPGCCRGRSGREAVGWRRSGLTPRLPRAPRGWT